MATVTVTDAGAMEPLDFIASLIHSLAWPLALIVVALIFRRAIMALIPNLSEASFLGTKWKFDHALKEAQAGIIASPDNTLSFALHHVVPPLAADRLPERIGRIVRTWNEIERWLRDKVRVEGLNPNPPVPSLIEAGVRQGVLTMEQAQSLRGLSAMRNLAVHGRPGEIDEGRVREFLTIAEAMKVILNIP